MTKNILIEGEYYKNDNKIDIQEGIDKKEGVGWEEKYEIKESNIMSLNEEEEYGIVRVTLEEV